MKRLGVLVIGTCVLIVGAPLGFARAGASSLDSQPAGVIVLAQSDSQSPPDPSQTDSTQSSDQSTQSTAQSGTDTLQPDELAEQQAEQQQTPPQQ